MFVYQKDNKICFVEGNLPKTTPEVEIDIALAEGAIKINGSAISTSTPAENA